MADRTPDDASPTNGDSIQIRGLRLLCRVGVPAEERAVAQPVEIDLDLAVDVATAARSDAVDDTVDYGAVAVAVADAATAGEHRLLERLASVVAETALDLDERVRAATVTVRKLRPPVPLDVASTGVRIHRSR